MKTKAGLLLSVTLFLVSCGLFSSGPTATAKKLMAATLKGDVNGIVNCYSASYISKEGGADKAKQKAQESIEFFRKMVKGAGHEPELQNIKERVNGDRADVGFRLGDPGKQGGEPILFHMVKENGEWKIDQLGKGEEAVDFLK